MPDYGEILRFLASNPPQLEMERKLHASLLELLAQCLRTDVRIGDDAAADGTTPADQEALREHIARSHFDWVHFN